jgi:hypothetical protein
MPTTSFVTDAELTAWINEGAQRLHEKLVDAMGEEYVSSSTAFTTVAGQSDYALPTTFLKLYGVDLNVGGVNKALRPYMRAERGAYRDDQLGMNRAPRYSLVGSNLRLYPVPSGGLTGAILYAPVFTLLSSGSDTCNFPNGWERYVVLYAAIQATIKEESSPSALMAVLEKEEADLDKFKMERDLAAPKQVVDLDIADFDWLY